MRIRQSIRLSFLGMMAMAAALIILAPGAVLAQRYEVNPYVGGNFPVAWIGDAALKSTAFAGVRTGVYVKPSLEIDGNLNYINHFEFKGVDSGNRALVWDANASYVPAMTKLGQIELFVTGGVGGVTALVQALDSHTQLLLDATGLDPELNMGVINITNGDTFFALNYGGGIKVMRLWGPMGWRADARNRIIPNFYGRVNSWMEASGGLTFTWGER